MKRAWLILFSLLGLTRVLPAAERLMPAADNFITVLAVAERTHHAKCEAIPQVSLYGDFYADALQRVRTAWPQVYSLCATSVPEELNEFLDACCDVAFEPLLFPHHMRSLKKVANDLHWHLSKQQAIYDYKIEDFFYCLNNILLTEDHAAPYRGLQKLYDLLLRRPTELLLTAKTAAGAGFCALIALGLYILLKDLKKPDITPQTGPGVPPSPSPMPNQQIQVGPHQSSLAHQPEEPKSDAGLLQTLLASLFPVPVNMAPVKYDNGWTHKPVRVLNQHNPISKQCATNIGCTPDYIGYCNYCGAFTAQFLIDDVKGYNQYMDNPTIAPAEYERFEKNVGTWLPRLQKVATEIDKAPDWKLGEPLSDKQLEAIFCEEGQSEQIKVIASTSQAIQLDDAYIEQQLKQQQPLRFAVHVPGHWIGMCVDSTKQEVKIFDSMHHGQAYEKRINNFLAELQVQIDRINMDPSERLNKATDAAFSGIVLTTSPDRGPLVQSLQTVAKCEIIKFHPAAQKELTRIFEQEFGPENIDRDNSPYHGIDKIYVVLVGRYIDSNFTKEPKATLMGPIFKSMLKELLTAFPLLKNSDIALREMLGGFDRYLVSMCSVPENTVTPLQVGELSAYRNEVQKLLGNVTGVQTNNAQEKIQKLKIYDELMAELNQSAPVSPAPAK